MNGEQAEYSPKMKTIDLGVDAVLPFEVPYLTEPDPIPDPIPPCPSRHTHPPTNTHTEMQVDQTAVASSL